MDNQDYLIKRGWKQDEASRRMWVDPKYGKRWAMATAVEIQRDRDAERLDTALAALERARLVLSDYVEHLTLIGAIEVEEASAALAAVRAAREGKGQ